MKDSDLWSFSKVVFFRYRNAVQVIDKRGKVMMVLRTDGVPATIPEVIDNDFAILSKLGTKRVIEIDGKTIPMTHNKPGTIRVSMMAECNDSAIGHDNILDGMWFGYLPSFIRSTH